MDGEDNKEDKAREEDDMTLSLVFPKPSKVVQKCPRLVWSKSIFQVLLTVTHLLDHFWTALDTLLVPFWDFGFASFAT